MVGTGLGARANRARLYGIGRPRTEDEVASRARLSINAAAREQQMKRAQEEISGLVQAGRMDEVRTMAETGQTPEAREAALVQLLKSGQYGQLAQYKRSGNYNQADWDRFTRNNPDTEKILAEKRGDLLGAPSSILQGLENGTISGISVLSADESFFTEAATEAAALAALPAGTPGREGQARAYLEMIEQRVAKDPGVLNRLTNQKIANVNSGLAAANQILGQPPLTLVQVTPPGGGQSDERRREPYSKVLPEAASIAAPGLDRDLFRSQMKLPDTQDAVAEVLVTGAPGAAIYQSVLEEMHRNYAVAPTVVDRTAINGTLDRMSIRVETDIKTELERAREAARLGGAAPDVADRAGQAAGTARRTTLLPQINFIEGHRIV